MQTMKNTNGMIKLINYTYIMFGVSIGVWQLHLGLISLLTFNNHEHWTSWAIVISGPLFILPAFLLGLFSQRISVCCIFIGATTSLSFMIISDWPHEEHLLNFAIMISFPMYILGILCILRHKFLSCKSNKINN